MITDRLDQIETRYKEIGKKVSETHRLKKLEEHLDEEGI